MTFSERLKHLPANIWKSNIVSIHPISKESELWYATVECRLTPEQEEHVNPAGFSIGKAYLNPADNLPCLIYNKSEQSIGYIKLKKWMDPTRIGFSWSYYIDQNFQGQGYGKAAAELAVQILKALGPHIPIMLSVEQDNHKAQKLYESIGFVNCDEMDGDNLIYTL